MAYLQEKVQTKVQMSQEGTKKKRFIVLIKFLKKNSMGVIGAFIIGVMVILTVLAPWIAPYDPITQDLINKLAAPSNQHILGTDDLGRDILSRLLYGARISLFLGFIIILFAGVAGTLIGIISGYLGGWIDSLFMRIADMFLAFPKLILAMVIAASLGPSIKTTIIAISISWWPEYARLSRSQALAQREAEYVLSAKALGYSNLRIILRHILPNSLAPVGVKATMDIGYAIIYAAGLTFIGFGVQAPTPEWGAMVASGRNFIYDAWWVSTLPGLLILLVGVSFNLVGDTLRDIFDPRLK